MIGIREWVSFAVFSDIHAPLQSDSALALAKEYVRREKPKHIILNGDILECASVSKFRDPRHVGPRNWKREVEAGIAVVDDFSQVFGKAIVHYIEGNHEWRLPKFLHLQAPEMEGEVSIPDRFQMARRGWIWVPADRGDSGIMDLTDKLSVGHGWRASATGSNNVAKTSLLEWGKSLILGHNHAAGWHRDDTVRGEDKVCWVSGCLADPPLYRRVDRWTRGFVAGAYCKRTGRFIAEHVNISGRAFDEMFVPGGGYVKVVKTQVDKNSGRGLWMTSK